MLIQHLAHNNWDKSHSGKVKLYKTRKLIKILNQFNSLVINYQKLSFLFSTYISNNSLKNNIWTLHKFSFEGNNLIYFFYNTTLMHVTILFDNLQHFRVWTFEHRETTGKVISDFNIYWTSKMIVQLIKFSLFETIATIYDVIAI